MHGAALAAANAGCAAIDFRKERIKRTAFGNEMAMPAMGRRNPVLVAQMGANSHGDSLLADIQMNRPGELAGLEISRQPELDLTNGEHGSIQMEQVIVRNI